MKAQKFRHTFTKDQIISTVQNGKAVLYKVLEDLKSNDNKAQVRVAVLEEKEKKKGKITFKAAEEKLLKVQEKIKTIQEVVVEKPKQKNAQPLFTFAQELLNDLQKEIKPVSVPQKKRQAIAEPESDSEEEIPKKDPPQKKGAKVEVEKKVKIEKQQEEPKPVPRGRKSGKKETKADLQDVKVVKKEAVDRPTRIARGVKKPVNYEESQEQVQDEPEDEESGSESRSRSQSKEKKGSKSKKPSKGGKQPTKFVKGRFNPAYQTFVTEMAQFESRDSEFVDHASVKLNNKELIRAAKTGNMDLLLNVLSTKSKISDLFERWAPENDVNAIELMFLRRDKDMLQEFVKQIAGQKLNLTRTPQCSLKEVNTGYNDKYAYGVRTRKVALGRGNREGNNAFVYDLAQEQTFSPYLFERLAKIETDPNLYSLLTASGAYQHTMVHTLYESVAHAVRSGNIKTAAHLVKEIQKKSPHYGFNQVHVDVLNGTNPSKLGQIKKISCTKKNTGQYLITPIHCACINPNPGFLEKLLEISQEYNITDEQMRKPIHYAAASQTPATVELLLKLRVDPREGDRNKTTPLMVAAQYGRAHNIKLLAGDNVNGKNRDGNAAIHYAAMGGHVEAVKELIAHGAQVNQPGQGRQTPILIASAHGHFELVKYLHEQGGKFNTKDKFGRNSVVMAARNGNLKILSYLLMHGGDFNQADSSSNTAIHYAAAYGFMECIDELIKAGASQNVTNSWKLTPLSVALQKNHFGVVKGLLNYPSTDVNCKDDEGRTLISSSLDKFTSDSFDYIKFLITEKNADVTIPDLKGKTPLHYAVNLTKKSIKAYYDKWHLIKREERKTIKNTYATMIEELLELLIANGADINKEDASGTSPFFQALKAANYATVRLFLKQNPNITIVDKQDKNILHLMYENGLLYSQDGLDIINEILKIDVGVDYNLVDEFGFTPLLTAIHRYTSGVTNVHSTLLNRRIARIQKRKFEEVIALEPETTQMEQEQDPGFNFQQQNEDEEEGASDDDQEEDEEEIPRFKKGRRHYARTYQAARASHPAFGGKGPAMGGGLFGQNIGQSSFGQAPQFQGFGDTSGGGLFGQQQALTVQLVHQKTFYFNNKPIIVGLTNEELKVETERAWEEFDTHQEGFLFLYKELVNRGACPDTAIGKLKKFREPVIGQLNQSPYSDDGLKTISHFIFQNYHNLKFLQSLLPLNLNARDHHDKTPLHYFADRAQAYHCGFHVGRQHTNSDEFLQGVIADVDIHAKDKNRRTLTHILATRYVPQLLKIAIEHGGEINAVTKDNVVPLHSWVKKGNLANVQALLEYADPNFPDNDKRTALHHAINKSNSEADASFEMEQLLLDNGAKANILDKLGRTPLFYAFVKIGDKANHEIDPFETVSSILANNLCEVTIIDKFGRNPLHYAACRGSIISGRYMVKLGAPVDEPDKEGNTPLALAFISGHSNFCTMLIDNKANVSRIAVIIDHAKLKQERKDERVARRLNGEEVESSEDERDQEDQDSQPLQQSQFGQMGNGLFGQQPQFGGFGGFGGFGQQAMKQPRKVATRYGQQTQDNSAVQTKFPAGAYSYFRLAIKHGWQGVAYLMISDGFDLQRAIEDAMVEGQFKLVRTLLMKVKDDGVVRKSNAQGQNLFHVFALKGQAAPYDIAILIINELLKRGVDVHAVDDQQRTPLHYSAERMFMTLTLKFLELKCNANLYDNTYNTPFTLQLQKSIYETLEYRQLPKWINAGADLNTRFRLKDQELTPFMYLIQEHHIEDELLLRALINHGACINDKNHKGETALIIAIKNNSFKLVNFLISERSFNPEVHASDQFQKTPIHHVVQPVAYGSYENEEILKVLIPLFDINQKDNQQRTALDYANDQDSGVMKNILLRYNAQIGRPTQQRLPTSIVAEAQWPEEEIDVEADAEKFMNTFGDVVDETKTDPRLEIDNQARQNAGKLELYVDENGPYTLLMTKVDVQNGSYSENVFYKMQIIHELNRNVFILFTRWGRIGTPGQCQLTPFENAEGAIKEFGKIFSSKSGGNEWRRICQGEPFEKKAGKYQLMTQANTKSYKQHLVPFDYSNRSPYPKFTLDKQIARVMFQFSQVKLYQRDLEQFHIDLDFMPLERLNRAQLERAKHYLILLTELVEELVELRKKSDFDIEEITRVQTEINENSSRFYELVPQREMRTEPLPPIDTIPMIQQKLLLIETLLNFEITSKILLGAHLNKDVLHPLNYCFNALNIRMLPLPLDHPEAQLITSYANASDKVQISNIFAIERRGEADRFDTHKVHKRMLLWHGSKISNFMGILAQGLKVAPPWAMSTGSMFGKGIYFADMFQKSYGYTADWSLNYNTYNSMFQDYNYNRGIQQDEQQEIQRYRYMLLCEVAVGTSMECIEPTDVQDLPIKYQSVKGVGQTGPDYKQTITLANGCKVPAGQVITYELPALPAPKHYMLQHNEYIVYDESKVKVRYMVQIDTRSNKDEF